MEASSSTGVVRRCRRRQEASTTTVSILKDVSTRHKLRRRYMVAFGVLLLVCVALLVVQLSHQLVTKSTGARSRTNTLVPPNPEVPQPPSPSLERRFLKGVVCSDGAPCSAVGRDILAMNGSAVDAAVAALLCNGVVNCQSMGLGGGFLLTLYLRQSRTVVTLDARECAPANANEEAYRQNPSLSKRGPLAVAVPGELKGYWELHRRYGRLPWATLVAPALRVCLQGYNMTQHQADSLHFMADILNDPTFREVFIDPETQQLKKVGSLVKHRILCKTLKIISERGGNELYKGTLAKMLVQDIQAMGGNITDDDLHDYRVKWREPVQVELRDGVKLYSSPLPGSGELLAFILKVLEGYHFSNASIGSIDSTILTYHRMLEAFKFAFGLRTHLGDPDFVNIDDLVANLTSTKYADSIRELIRDDQTVNHSKYYGAVTYNKDDHGTAHLSVISPDGDAVSVTSTINLYFGAGIASQQTGIILNSGMDDFSLGYKNYFDLPASKANSLAPGKRPLSSMCPTIIVDESGDVRMVVGASGGTKITTAVAYVIMRHLWFGETIKQAVDASRIHHQLFPMEVSYEYGVLDQVVKGLQKLGHETSRYRERGSIICAVTKQDGYVYANADYRKGGEVFGID